MTLGELKAKFYDLIGEDSSSLVNVTAATAGRLLNDAYREIARMTGAIEKIHVARVVSGTAEYTLPDDAGKIIRVAYDGERIWPHSALEMDAIDQYWETRSGQVDRYVTDRENNNAIRLYKNPDTNGAGAVMDGDSWTVAGTVLITLASQYITVNVTSHPFGTVASSRNGYITAWTATGLDEAPTGTFDATTANILVVSSTELRVFPDGFLSTDIDSGTVSFEFIGFEDSDQSELGTMAYITDGTNTYTFAADTTNNPDHTDEDYGIVVKAVTADGSPVYDFSSEFGVMIDFDFLEDNLEVWYKVDPEELADDGDDSPAMPSWAHLAIAFQAAKEYLLNETEGGNEGLSDLYGQMAEDYITRLRVTVSNRTPERTHYMNDRGALARPRGMGSAQLPSNYPRYYG